MRVLVAILFGLSIASLADAANYPCSGRKGGVSHCEGTTFICNDGTASRSKRSCSATLGTNTTRSPALNTNRTVSSECPCSSGNLCTGPKGGRYCITAGGNKSYK